VDSLDKAKFLVESLAPHVGCFKVGLELLTAVATRIFSGYARHSASLGGCWRPETSYDSGGGNQGWHNGFGHRSSDHKATSGNRHTRRRGKEDRGRNSFGFIEKGKVKDGKDKFIGD